MTLFQPLTLQKGILDEMGIAASYLDMASAFYKMNPSLKCHWLTHAQTFTERILSESGVKKKNYFPKGA